MSTRRGTVLVCKAKHLTPGAVRASFEGLTMTEQPETTINADTPIRFYMNGASAIHTAMTWLGCTEEVFLEMSPEAVRENLDEAFFDWRAEQGPQGWQVIPTANRFEDGPGRISARILVP